MDSSKQPPKDILKTDKEELQGQKEMTELYETLTVIQPIYQKIQEYLVGCLILTGMCIGVIKRKILIAKSNKRITYNIDNEE